MDPLLQQQLLDASRQLMQVIWKAGIALFTIMLFKDMISEFAQNVFLYIKMRLDKNLYTVKGGKVELNGEEYVIKNITFGYVFLRKVGNGKCCRLTTKDYWTSKIIYYDDPDLKESRNRRHNDPK